MKRQNMNREPRLGSRKMQPGGQEVHGNRCNNLKKNMTALEVITWLVFNEKYH